MAELKTILEEATDRSLVLVDELCRGTDVGKGSFIAASVIETLDRIGCMGVLSTHLHDLLDMELRTRYQACNLVVLYKSSLNLIKYLHFLGQSDDLQNNVCSSSMIQDCVHG